MTGQLAGKRAFITGGGGALGSASGLAFAGAGAGASVAVVDIVADAADETVRQIVAQGGEAVSIVADVCDEEQVRRAVAEAVEALGGLDTLFNNAGVMPHQDRSVLGTDLELWQTITAINLHGTALCSKYAVPHIAPGPIMTAHVEQFFPDPEARQLWLSRVPLGRFGTPEDVAALALFFASDAASWLTGQVVVLDGGISCNYL